MWKTYDETGKTQLVKFSSGKRCGSYRVEERFGRVKGERSCQGPRWLLGFTNRRAERCCRSSLQINNPGETETKGAPTTKNKTKQASRHEEKRAEREKRKGEGWSSRVKKKSRTKMFLFFLTRSKKEKIQNTIF